MKKLLPFIIILICFVVVSPSLGDTPKELKGVMITAFLPPQMHSEKVPVIISVTQPISEKGCIVLASASLIRPKKYELGVVLSPMKMTCLTENGLLNEFTITGKVLPENGMFFILKDGTLPAGKNVTIVIEKMNK
jgi:hypothetical protein